MPAECEGQPNAAACWGGQLYTKNGCNNCHGIDGVAQAPAPNWRGLFGRQEHLVGGQAVTVDENYIRESILQPQAKITNGYASVVMPPFRLSDAQIDAIIAYMKTLH